MSFGVALSTQQEFLIGGTAGVAFLGSYSKYNYQPTQNIFVDNEMVGDTINLFIETVFNTDFGESEIIEDNIKVIIK